MERVIKLIMKENRNIEILVDNVLTYTVQFNNREISAEKIVEIFNISSGDTCKVEKDNPLNKDSNVLNMFVEVFQEIANKINAIPKDTVIIGESKINISEN